MKWGVDVIKRGGQKKMVVEDGAGCYCKGHILLSGG